MNNRKLVARPDKARRSCGGQHAYCPFTASNVGRLLHGDCRYWTVDFEVWSVLIVTWAAGVAIHATFQNRHFRSPKIRGLGLGRTEEKFADSDDRTKCTRLIALLFYDFTCTAVGLRYLGNEYELTGAITERRLRPISMRSGPMGSVDAMQLVDHAYC